MKWIYRFVTVTMLAGVLAVPFFMKNKDGEPMLSVPSADDLVPSSNDLKILQDNPERLMGQRTVYKWQDEHGQWHYGDAPPQNNTQVSTIQVDSQTNIIQSLKVENEEQDQVASNSGGILPGGTLPNSTQDVLTVENALNIIENAQTARALMEQRGDQLKQIVGEEP